MVHFWRIWIFSFLVLGISACTVGPNFEEPKDPEVSSYVKDFPEYTQSSETQGGEAQHFIFGKKVKREWWKLFKSPHLDALMEKALLKSPTLEAAKAAIYQAQENLNALVGSTQYPSLGFAGLVQRQKSSDAVGSTDGSTYNYYNPALNISYTFDFFGGAYRAMEGLISQVSYQKFLWEAACLTLTSTLVNTVIMEASLREQISIIESMIKSEKSILDILNLQFSMGAIAQMDVLAQEALLAETQSLLPDLEKQLSQTRHALSALVGDFPESVEHPTFTFEELALPKELPISLPSILVRMRPDIKASEAILHQASANIGVARANQFPQFTITGMVGTQADSTHYVVGHKGTVWSIGSSLLQPIFNGGALSADVRAAEAAYTQAFALYRETVLTAFQNMADALRSLEIDARNLHQWRRAENIALKSLEVTRSQFTLGGATYLLVLNAEERYLKTRLRLVQARTSRFLDTVGLFQALGGGCDLHISEKYFEKVGSAK